jgi:hypothetical protein
MAITILTKETYFAGYLVVSATSDVVSDRLFRVSFSDPLTPNSEIREGVRLLVQRTLADERAQRKADRVAARVARKVEELNLTAISTTEVEAEGGY